MPDFIRKHTRLRGFDYSSAHYVCFITICVCKKQPFFLNKQLAIFVQKSIENRQKQKEINLLCYCIMPNHIHLLLSLDETYKQSLSVWVSSFKRYVSKEAKDKYNISPMWQRNYYDHIVRTEESLSKIGEYILNNPVRRNLAKRWENYPFCKLYFENFL
jgi:putative transposase